MRVGRSGKEPTAYTTDCPSGDIWGDDSQPVCAVSGTGTMGFVFSVPLKFHASASTASMTVTIPATTHLLLDEAGAVCRNSSNCSATSAGEGRARSDFASILRM